MTAGRLTPVLGCVALLLPVLTSCGGEVGETAPAAPPTATSELEDFSFVSGRWLAEVDGDVLEEWWGEPVGNCVVGSFRWMHGDKARFYEYMIIEKREEQVWFHLRHFSPGLVAWEEKDEAMSYPLLRLTETEAVFEHESRNEPKRFVYRRENENTLVVEIHSVNEAGETRKQGFTFTRGD